MVNELEAKGADRSTTAPGLFRLLWMFGLPVAPPLFLGFLPATLIFGISFALVICVVFWLVLQVHMLLFSVIAGIVGGFILSGYYGRKAKTLHLPAWKEYGVD